MVSGQYGAPTDVWSAGIILHLLLTGCNPFRGASEAITEYRCVYPFI
jgi:calcium/calmodulin-dependent serine protein kinase